MAVINIAALFYITKLTGFPIGIAMKNYFLISEEEGIKIPWEGTIRSSIIEWAREEIAMEE